MVIQGEIKVDRYYDGGSISCGELIMNIYKEMKALEFSQVLEVVSYDLGAVEDVPAWCRMQGHTLLHMKDEGFIKTHFYIKKGEKIT